MKPTAQRTAARVLVPLLLAACVGCADSTIKTLGEENGALTDNEPGAFRFQAFELDNVHDEVVVRWVNPEGRASVSHRSFMHHGQGAVTVLDAADQPLYSTPVEYQLDNQTHPGLPGTWTVRIQLFGSRGRVDVALSSLAGEGDPDLEPPLPPQLSP
ncbi:hypothetical protein [Pyxidicoccus trucidator]|uniref:hypothetical protein n=1 Tax=Pyxidicoccus trucidator TaxID=2709662 RepID=UPI0013DA6404|nr:hypothetical protein [Pyxidicoccus trucidator]